MAEQQNKKECPKDCKLCSFQQHAYCAAQLAYNNMISIQNLSDRLDALEQKSSIFSQGTLADPLDLEDEYEDEDIAQSEGGADE